MEPQQTTWPKSHCSEDQLLMSSHLYYTLFSSFPAKSTSSFHLTHFSLAFSLPSELLFPPPLCCRVLGSDQSHSWVPVAAKAGSHQQPQQLLLSQLQTRMIASSPFHPGNACSTQPLVPAGWGFRSAQHCSKASQWDQHHRGRAPFKPLHVHGCTSSSSWLGDAALAGSSSSCCPRRAHPAPSAQTGSSACSALLTATGLEVLSSSAAFPAGGPVLRCIYKTCYL